jgi:hypothetical protein
MHEPSSEERTTYHEFGPRLARAHLAALAGYLRGQRLRAEDAETGVLVSDPDRPDVGMLVTCNPRPSDRDRMWLWAPGGVPLAEADRIADAALAIRARLLELAAEPARRS